MEITLKSISYAFLALLGILFFIKVVLPFLLAFLVLCLFCAGAYGLVKFVQNSLNPIADEKTKTNSSKTSSAKAKTQQSKQPKGWDLNQVEEAEIVA